MQNKNEDLNKIGELAAEFSRDNIIPVMHQHMEILIDLLKKAHENKNYYEAMGYISHLTKMLFNYREHSILVYGALTGLLGEKVTEENKSEIDRHAEELVKKCSATFAEKCKEKSIPSDFL